ncbi:MULTISPECIES: hypothetical protein [unclassified Pantoea]|uniref:hypothetical protein n=1 Tax=unclassified Pantoea TaxID=2630326 RepID=UPI00301DC529
MQIGRAVHGADALLFGRAFAGPQVNYRFMRHPPLTIGAVGEENCAMNEKYRYFPASSDPLSFAKSSVTTLLTRASLRFILPDNLLVVENPIANAR